MSSSPFSLMSPRSMSTPEPIPGTMPVHGRFDGEGGGKVAPSTITSQRTTPVGQSSQGSLSPDTTNSASGFSLDKLAFEIPPVPISAAPVKKTVPTAQNSKQTTHSPLFNPPSVLELMGSPPTLPNLQSGHPLAPLVEELRVWVLSSLDLYESRDKQRQAVMSQCIAAAHAQAVSTAKRLGKELQSLARELESTKALLKERTSAVLELERKLFDAETGVRARVEEAVSTREKELLASSSAHIESLEAQIALLVDRTATAEARVEYRALRDANTSQDKLAEYKSDASVSQDLLEKVKAAHEEEIAMLRSQTEQQIASLTETHRLELLKVTEKGKAESFRQLSELKAQHAHELHSVRLKAAKLVEDTDLVIEDMQQQHSRTLQELRTENEQLRAAMHALESERNMLLTKGALQLSSASAYTQSQPPSQLQYVPPHPSVPVTVPQPVTQQVRFNIPQSVPVEVPGDDSSDGFVLSPADGPSPQPRGEYTETKTSTRQHAQRSGDDVWSVGTQQKTPERESSVPLPTQPPSLPVSLSNIDAQKLIRSYVTKKGDSDRYGSIGRADAQSSLISSIDESLEVQESKRSGQVKSTKSTNRAVNATVMDSPSSNSTLSFAEDETLGLRRQMLENTLTAVRGREKGGVGSVQPSRIPKPRPVKPPKTMANNSMISANTVDSKLGVEGGLSLISTVSEEE